MAPPRGIEQLEQQSVYVLREAFRHFERLCMLWSIGKDSTVLLWLARKAFFGHVPFPLVHIDEGYELPEMLTYRDRLAKELNLRLIVGRNDEAIAKGLTFPSTQHLPDDHPDKVTRFACCTRLKSEALRGTLDGSMTRWRFDQATAAYVEDEDRGPYTGVIVGARADEEGSRSKERTFSPRDKNHLWDIADQPPEFWNQFKTDYAPGTHVRIHPLLDWTEVQIWEYIERERIPTVSLYYDQGQGRRYRSLGCEPCQASIESHAKNPQEVLVELRSGRLRNIAERSGRLQDGKHGLEELRRGGYM
ncbi:MAG: sulfate adenylyltransferase subunit CysD [Myxococcales bacterium]|nr:sulfate adenylyltransferase subunit CysD [Myxococcales bacterium]